MVKSFFKAITLIVLIALVVAGFFAFVAWVIPIYDPVLTFKSFFTWTSFFFSLGAALVIAENAQSKKEQNGFLLGCLFTSIPGFSALFQILFL